MNLIAIGVDQSKQATGLCMRKFDLKGRSKLVRVTTVETPTYNAMRDALIPTFIGLNTPTVVFAEDGFPRCNVDTYITRAWVEAVVYQYRLGELFGFASAKQWRKVVWPDKIQLEGSDKLVSPANLKRADAKLYSEKFFYQKNGVKAANDNEADADGIARYAITAYLKHLEERIDE